MPFFSISCKKPGRVGQPKTAFAHDDLAPTPGVAVELRVDLTAYDRPLAFWSDLRRLTDRMRELHEPRPRPGSLEGANVYESGVYDSGVYE